MSERGRSKLFGRPGELLVDEPPPRIRMPVPPPEARAPVDDFAEESRTDIRAADEEPSITGPLRIFVGPPAPRQIAPDAGPPLRLAPARDPEPPPAAARPPAPPRPVPTRPGDTLPGGLMSDATGELGDILGRRVPAPRQPARTSASDPLRTELPVVEARSPRRPPSSDDGLRTELPSFDLFGGMPEPTPPRPPPRDAAVALPLATERPKAQGIPTAAARARTARVPQGQVGQGPGPAGYEEENTRIEEMPLQIFERQRPARGEAPPNDKPRADDPRFRSAPAPSDSGFGANHRVPPRSSSSETLDLTGVTNPGLRPTAFGEPAFGEPAFGEPAFGEPALAPAPVAVKAGPSVSARDAGVVPAPAVAAAPKAVAAPPKASPAPPKAPVVKPSEPRLTPRQARVGAGMFVVLLLAVVGWQWSIRNPGALARLRPAPRPAAAAPAVAPAITDAQAAPDAPVATDAVADAPVADTPAEVPPDVAQVEGPAEPSPPAEEPPVAITPPPVVAPPAPAPAEKVPVAATSSGQSASGAVANPVSDRRGGYQQPMGLLLVTCDRKATVYVDNVKKGSTGDGKPIELTAGTHRLKVVAGGSSRTQTARVDANQLNLVQCGIR